MIKDTKIEVRCTRDELEAWRALAGSRETTISAIVRSLLNEDAKVQVK